MRIPVNRWIRGFRGLVRCGGLIGIHGSAILSLKGTFVFGKGVSVARNSLIQVPQDSTLSLGDAVKVGREVEISPSPDIVIGDYTSLQDRCIVLGQVSIGAYCLVAPNVLMSSGTHRFMENPAWLIRDQDQLPNDPGYQLTTPPNLPIRVEEDCWIGINSVIMRGVTIGRGSVVGANSVVTKSIAPYSVVTGAPARLIRQRLVFVPPREISGSNPDDLPYFYSGFDHRRSTRSRFPAGMRASGRFRVALDWRGSRNVHVEIDAPESCVLKYSAQEATLHAGLQTVSFALEGSPAGGLFDFEVNDAGGRPCSATVRRVSAGA